MSFFEDIQSPPPQFSPAAFWFWYGDLKPDVLRKQIDMMVEQGVYNGFMHARAYLKTPYLEDDWWKAVDACIDEGEKVGFYPWLYDEYAWPSGTAGSTFKYGYQKPSLTLSKGECNMAKYLVIKKYSSVEKFNEDVYGKNLIAAFYLDEEKWHYATDNDVMHGKITAFFKEHSPRFVDYMNPDTIREFMRFTHEEYKKRYSEFFGNRIPGIFFDEIFMICKIPWTDRLPDEFLKRCGYELIPVLYALAQLGGEEERKIRNDYYTVVSQLYEETFFVQISEWCNENKLELTGHIEEAFVQHPGRQGQFFNNMRHLDIPGADCHDYRYRFPRKITYREPKFSVSVARAYGKKRMMSEALGGAGWGCSLQQFKRGVNTLGAMGINMITLHGFSSECTTQGEQADWPSSFFFQNPYWRYFKHFANYINRICYMNTLGTPVVDVGIYFPIDEMQMETVNAAPTDTARKINQAWNNAINILIENQIDVDMVDEPCLLNAKISNCRINIGVQSFRILLCPDLMQPSVALKEKLNEFVNCGGIVLYYSCNESCEDGILRTQELPDEIEKHIQTDVKVLWGTRDNLFMNHRKIDDKNVYFVSNSAPRSRSLVLLLREKGTVCKLSPEDGTRSKFLFQITENGTQVQLSLEADEAYWLVLDAKIDSQTATKEIVCEELAVAGKWEFIPISCDIKGVKQLEVKSSRLNIPLAVFSSEIHPDGRMIRIQNTEEEKGYCGRHLSLWKAKWITRRLDWTDSSMKEELYFRKKLIFDDKPSAAKICIGAVNEWIMWINGEKVAYCSKGRKPTVIDACKYLTAGENLIAIQVVNRTPMEHFNLLSVDHLPPEEMISLIMQAKINIGEKTLTICSDEHWEVNDNFIEGWEKTDYKAEKIIAHSTTANMFGGEDTRWTQAWERGCPPLLPWGEVPLFGKKVSYPQRICYSIVLPAGTAKVFYPDVTGSEISITVDGMNLNWDNGECVLKPDGLTHQLQIAVTANCKNDGLHSNVEIKVAAFRHTLCDWRLHGLSWYSGFARYRNNMFIKKQPGHYILKLGQTSFQAEVWINGIYAGDRVWEPYQLDVTDLIKNGENEFVIIVSNSAAVKRQFMLVDEGSALGWNRYWNDDNIQREGENLVSGLQGPIQLIRKYM